MKVLVTGAAGFIGFHVSQRLVERGDEVVGLDILNDYYEVQVKYGRMRLLGIDAQTVLQNPGKVVSGKKERLSFVQLDLNDKAGIDSLFEREKFDAVINLAAQAGVRYSLTRPDLYLSSNIAGFLNLLEALRRFPVQHFVYASSSSVYGSNSRTPFSTHDNVDHPVSLYAASKKSNELMAHTYSHLFKIPTTGLRFFTVYGPWGRPDMALFLFTKAILAGEPIQVFNYGEMRRDFTYIDDIVEGVVRVLDHAPQPQPELYGQSDPATSHAPYKIYNIGKGAPVRLLDFIEELENQLGLKAQKNFLPLQPGDVPTSHADIHDLVSDLGYKPSTTVSEGIAKFLEWYQEFYGEAQS
ncbi:MAG: NAD-dependent epimerase [Spirochaetales bacterium]|nr:NAD-dependent epimerase [Spirochaetales bacterium]